MLGFVSCPESLHALQHSGMEQLPLEILEAAIRRLLREGMAEFPHFVGVARSRREKGGVSQGAHLFPHRRRREIAGADEHRERPRLPDRRGALEYPSSSGRELVHPSRNDIANTLGDDEGRHWRLHSERAPTSCDQAGIDQRPNTFLEVEGIAACLRQDLRSRARQRWIRTEEVVQHLVGALVRQRSQVDLRETGTSPRVSILRAVRTDQQHTRAAKRLHRRIEDVMTLWIDPLQILEDQHEGILLR